jgi:hypothetical protein
MTDVPDWLSPVAELRRVVPVVREVARRAGGRLIVSSVEIWVGLVVVNYAVTAHDFSHREAAMNDRGTSIADDLGTRYRMYSGGSGGGSNDLVVWCQTRFAPSVPDEARVLRVTSSMTDATIEVAL